MFSVVNWYERCNMPSSEETECLPHKVQNSVPLERELSLILQREALHIFSELICCQLPVPDLTCFVNCILTLTKGLQSECGFNNLEAAICPS